MMLMLPAERFVAFFLLAVCMTSVMAQSASAPLAIHITGQWQSPDPESYGSHYATRTFTLTEQDWKVLYQAYADPQARQPLFSIRAFGVYVLGEVSGTVANAREGIFTTHSRSVTADSDAGVQMFAAMGCTLVYGQETALSGTDCGIVPGLTPDNREDHELVALDKRKLYFGDHSGDSSGSYPDRLTPYPLIRLSER